MAQQRVMYVERTRGVPYKRLVLVFAVLAVIVGNAWNGGGDMVQAADVRQGIGSIGCVTQHTAAAVDLEGVSELRIKFRLDVEPFTVVQGAWLLSNGTQGPAAWWYGAESGYGQWEYYDAGGSGDPRYRALRIYVQAGSSGTAWFKFVKPSPSGTCFSVSEVQVERIFRANGGVVASPPPNGAGIVQPSLAPTASPPPSPGAGSPMPSGWCATDDVFTNPSGWVECGWGIPSPTPTPGPSSPDGSNSIAHRGATTGGTTNLAVGDWGADGGTDMYWAFPGRFAGAYDESFAFDPVGTGFTGAGSTYYVAAGAGGWQPGRMHVRFRTLSASYTSGSQLSACRVNGWELRTIYQEGGAAYTGHTMKLEYTNAAGSANSLDGLTWTEADSVTLGVAGHSGGDAVPKRFIPGQSTGSGIHAGAWRIRATTLTGAGPYVDGLRLYGSCTVSSATDTDGDGSTDADEFAAGTDHTDEDSYPDAPEPTTPPLTPPPGWGTPPPFIPPDIDVNVDICEDEPGILACATLDPEASFTPQGGGTDDDGQPGSGTGESGFAVCDGDNRTPVNEKVGYQPYDTVEDVPDAATYIAASGGSVFNPMMWPAALIGTMGWVGDNVRTIAPRTANAVKWAVNTGVDFAIPGECVGVMFADFQDDIGGRAPFAYVGEVTAAVSAAYADPVGDDLTLCYALPFMGADREFCLADFSGDAAAIRPFLVALVWLGAAFVVASAVMGTVGVGNGGGDRG